MLPIEIKLKKKQIYGIPSARQSNFIPNQARNKALVTYGAVRYTRIVRATNNEKLQKKKNHTDNIRNEVSYCTKIKTKKKNKI